MKRYNLFLSALVLGVIMISGQAWGDQIFFDDFESGSFTNWTETSGTRWRIGEATEEDVPGHDEENLVAKADRCKSPCTITMTNAVDLSGHQSATLSFWRFVDRSLDNNEYLKVEAFNGSSWNTIFYWTHRQGDDDIWHLESFDLSGYLVSNFSLRFVTKESKGNEDVEVDEVLIEGVPGATNQPPVANAGPNQTVTDSDDNGSEALTLDGTGSSDPDGFIVSYSWTEGVTVLGNTATITASFSVGTHTVTLEVTDEDGATSNDQTVITVNAAPPPPNQPPVADAGPDQNHVDSLFTGIWTQLWGVNSYDPDGNIASYVWLENGDTIASGPDPVVLFYVSVHTVSLLVTDDDGATASDEVIITVDSVGGAPKHAQPPIAASLTGSKIAGTSVLISPNPFNGRTELMFKVPTATNDLIATKADIYDVQGAHMVSLMDGLSAPGSMVRLNWDGSDDQGQKVKNGLYIYKIRMGDKVESGSILLKR